MPDGAAGSAARAFPSAGEGGIAASRAAPLAAARRAGGAATGPGGYFGPAGVKFFLYTFPEMHQERSLP